MDISRLKPGDNAPTNALAGASTARTSRDSDRISVLLEDEEPPAPRLPPPESTRSEFVAMLEEFQAEEAEEAEPSGPEDAPALPPRNLTRSNAVAKLKGSPALPPRNPTRSNSVIKLKEQVSREAAPNEPTTEPLPLQPGNPTHSTFDADPDGIGVEELAPNEPPGAPAAAEASQIPASMRRRMGRAFRQVFAMTPEQRQEKLQTLQEDLRKERERPIDTDKIAEAVRGVLMAKHDRSGRDRHKAYDTALQSWFEGLGHVGEQKEKAEKHWKQAGTIYPLRGAPMSLLTAAIPGVAAMQGASAAVSAAAGLAGFAAQPVITAGAFTMPVLSVCELLRGAGSRPVLHPSIEVGNTPGKIRKLLEDNAGELQSAMQAYAASPEQANESEVRRLIDDAEKLGQLHRNVVAVKQRQWVPSLRQGPVRGLKVGVNAALIVSGAAFSPPVALAAGVGSSAAFIGANMLAARYDEGPKMNFIHRMNMKGAIPFILRPESQNKLKNPESITGEDIDANEVRKLEQHGADSRMKFAAGVLNANLNRLDDKRAKLDWRIAKLVLNKDTEIQESGSGKDDQRLAKLIAKRNTVVQRSGAVSKELELLKQGRYQDLADGGLAQSLLLSDATAIYKDTLRRYATFNEMVPELAHQVAYYFHAGVLSYFGSTALAYTDKVVHEAMDTHASPAETKGVAASSLALGGLGAAFYPATSNARYLAKTQLGMADKEREKVAGKRPEPPELAEIDPGSTLAALRQRSSDRKAARVDQLKAALKTSANALVAGLTEPIGVWRMSRAHHKSKALVEQAKKLMPDPVARGGTDDPRMNEEPTPG